MSCLLQVSDPHFGTEQVAVVDALVRLSKAQQPDGLVLSGDVTQRATREQFDAARAFIHRLAIPSSLAIPGNHDIPLFALASRVLNPYGRWRRVFGEQLEPVLDRPDCLAIGVNATRWWRHENGEVSGEQIERVAALLAQAGDRLRIVVIHQPTAVTRTQDQGTLLRNREAAVRRWAEAGADLILGGHIHLPYVQPLERHFAGLPRRLYCVQAGTAVSSRVRADAPNSVNLIRTAGDRSHCVVERWDFSPSSGEFERVQTHALELGDMPTSSLADHVA